MSGFTETAVDQEAQGGENAVILVNASQAVQELIRGRMLVPVERATASAGQLAGRLPHVQFDDPSELMATALHGPGRQPSASCPTGRIANRQPPDVPTMPMLGRSWSALADDFRTLLSDASGVNPETDLRP